MNGRKAFFPRVLTFFIRNLCTGHPHVMDATFFRRLACYDYYGAPLIRSLHNLFLVRLLASLPLLCLSF